MKSATNSLLVLLLVVVAVVGGYIIGMSLTDQSVPDPVVIDDEPEDVEPDDEPEDEKEPGLTADYESDGGVVLTMASPMAESSVMSPMTVLGWAPGGWYFEATFPIVLTNWDGLIIAEGYATAMTDWMTEEMVQFESTIEFESPYSEGDPEFMQNGYLILQKANASGLPENDDALELRVKFTP